MSVDCTSTDDTLANHARYHLSCHCQANILALTVPMAAEATDSDVTGQSRDVASDTAVKTDPGAWDSSQLSTSRSGTTGPDSRINNDDPQMRDKHINGAGLEGTMVCDCSICLKHLSVFSVQPVERVRYIKGCVPGQGTLKVYMFGEKKGQHCFCGTCGTFMFALFKGYETHIGLNLRAVRQPSLDMYALSTYKSKMANVPPFYTHPTLPTALLDRLKKRQEHYSYETEVYTGSCHCQAVTFGVVAKPMKDEEVCVCTCSICQGNGAVWIYPGIADIVYTAPLSPSAPHIPDPSLVTRYSFRAGPNRNQHVFCNTCGIQVFETRGIDLEAKGGEEGAAGYRDTQKDCSLGVNIATFNTAGEWLADGRGAGMGWELDREAEGQEPLYELKLEGL